MSNEELVIRIRAGVDSAQNMEELYKQNRGMICKIASKTKAMQNMMICCRRGS